MVLHRLVAEVARHGDVHARIALDDDLGDDVPVEVRADGEAAVLLERLGHRRPHRVVRLRAAVHAREKVRAVAAGKLRPMLGKEEVEQGHRRGLELELERLPVLHLGGVDLERDAAR